MAIVARIAIIGNGGGGKTTLARILAARHGLSLTHVDSIQFLPGMVYRGDLETSQILKRLAAEERWLIDGFGSWEVIEKRFRRADLVVFVDFPLWRHYWWCTKRQVKSLWRPRTELPEGCDEATLAYTWRLYKILWRVHTQIRPRLLVLFAEPAMRPKVRVVRTVRDWRMVASGE